MYQQRDGGAALLIDRELCPSLVRALNGAYRFGKTKEGVTKVLPEKLHPWSDVADALQYAVMTVNSGLVDRIAKRIMPKLGKPKKTARVSAAGWT